MVKRYAIGLGGYQDDVYPEEYEDASGGWIKHDDYLTLRNALREALQGWTDWCKAYEYNDSAMGLSERDEKRIAQLRAQFLDDK